MCVSNFIYWFTYVVLRAVFVSKGNRVIDRRQFAISSSLDVASSIKGCCIKRTWKFSRRAGRPFWQAGAEVEADGHLVQQQDIELETTIPLAIMSREDLMWIVDRAGKVRLSIGFTARIDQRFHVIGYR